jgi:glycosyltransferase involved in cell wall biosynthesis
VPWGVGTCGFSETAPSVGMVSLPSRLKIWHVIDTLEVGGAETVVATLCREQQEAGHSPSVYCLARGGKLAEDLRARDVPVLVMGPDTLPSIARRMYGQMRAGKPDAIHCHNETPTIVCAGPARLAGVRRVITSYHGMVVPLRAPRLKFWVATRFCDYVVAVSKTTQANLEVSSLSCPEKILTIYNAAAPAERGTNGPPLCSPDEFPIVHVARHVAAKDIDTLLSAVDIARRTDPAIVLVLAGAGPLTPRHKETAARLRLGDAARFLGECGQVGHVLAQSKVFVLSSVNEGLPISLLEAMAAGLPQIVTAVGGMREVVNLAQSGLVVPPRNPEAMAEAILTFRARETWRQECAGRARECYEQYFTPRRMAADYEALYTRGREPHGSCEPCR